MNTRFDCARALAVWLLLAGTAAVQGSIAAVLNGASYEAVLAPGCWATVFGADLAAGTAAASTVPLPVELGGVRVTVGGIAAPLLYVSPTQINVLIPSEAPVPAVFGRVTPLVVSRAGAAPLTYNIALSRAAPGIFTWNANGRGRALVFDAGFGPVERVRPGDTVILYAAGIGMGLEVYLGERKLTAEQVLYAGPAPGYPGIYQLNLRVPEGMATDRVFLRAGGWQSNVAEIGIVPGGNVANVSGDVSVLYPAGEAVREFYSVALEAATFGVSFDIRAGAAPFAVAAVGEGASAVIRIDPALGRWESIASVPTAATRAGDFSAGLPDFVLVDFLSCAETGACLPMPGNIVPQARVHPLVGNALRSVPAANLETGMAGTLLRTGVLGADGKFAIPTGEFAGWVRLPFGPFASRAMTFKLYVDGVLIRTREASYALPHR